MKMPRYKLFALLLVVWSGLTLTACGDSRGDDTSSGAPLLSSEDPDERSRNSRDDRPEFQMTYELPDVSRRLTNWLNTCWLQAGVKELEFSYYRKRREGRPLSVEFSLMSSLHDRLMRITNGGSIRSSELEAGGELNEVRRLATSYGMVPESTWSQKSKDWGTIAKNLNPQAARLREKMERRRARGDSGADVIQEAERLFNQVLDDHDVHVPTWFSDNGKKTTPAEFATTFASENPDEFILLLAKSQYGTTPSKKDLETIQEGFLTSWTNIAQVIQDQIQQDRSVVLAVYWYEKAIKFNKGLISIDDAALAREREPVGHVVNIVGYHVNAAGELDRLKIENTWGRYEGSSGFYSVSWSDLKKIFMAINLPDGLNYIEKHQLRGVRLRDHSDQ
jgi:aminopeptidase C